MPSKPKIEVQKPELAYQSLARPPVAQKKPTPQSQKRKETYQKGADPNKSLEKTQSKKELTAEEIKVANQKALAQFEQQEAMNAVLSLPNTGDSSSDDDAPPVHHDIVEIPEEASDDEDEESVRAENDRLKAYLAQLQAEKFAQDV